MAKHLQKLELNWIGKGADKEPKLEPRILIEDTSKSFGNPKTENMLIHGDNLLALKALEQQFSGKIKCIAVDPPYNTGSAFEHYDDGIEHSLWLSLMNDRVKMFHKLLSNDGSIWIAIDDNEAHYLKVLLDEIFGRQNFIGNVIWEKADSPRMDAKLFSTRHDHILVYAKNIQNIKFNRLENPEEKLSHYNKVDENGRRYYLKPLRAMGGQGDSREARPSLYYPLIAPDGTEVYPKKQDGSDGAWRWNMIKVEAEKSRIEWLKTKGGWSANTRLYLDNSTGRPPETIWFNSEVGSNRTSTPERKNLQLGEKSFDTPKPEKLLKRIIHISTNEGDWVLDSFLGSGTTSAVAHKMKRKWIGVELGEHAITHCLPRLVKVVLGKDKGGVTEEANWKGGGGFKFYNLAPSLIQKDKYGNDIINPTYNPNMLAAAMAKQEGFRYQPHESTYWKQGNSTEKDYIFTTTQFITVEMLDRLAEEMQPNESLLVCCKGFAAACKSRHSNITIKKIPQMLFGRCEFGKDDYSLNIVNLPHDENDNTGTDEDEINIEETTGKKSKTKSKKDKDEKSQSSLF